MSTMNEEELVEIFHKVVSQYATSNCWVDGNGPYEEVYEVTMAQLIKSMKSRDQQITSEAVHNALDYIVENPEVWKKRMNRKQISESYKQARETNV